jgi:hypothetical protein
VTGPDLTWTPTSVIKSAIFRVSISSNIRIQGVSHIQLGGAGGTGGVGIEVGGKGGTGKGPVISSAHRGAGY